MSVFFSALIFFGLFIALMAVGVIFSDRQIKGSCGGLNALPDESGNFVCGVCGQSVAERKDFDDVCDREPPDSSQ